MSKEQNKQYGGQAVIEGVMMKGSNNMAVAVRRAEDNIVIKEEELSSPAERVFLFKWPFIRGVVTLFYTLFLGMKTLSFSANQAAEEEGEEIKAWEMGLSMLVAFGLAVVIFVVFPAAVINSIKGFIEGFPGSNIVLNMIEGLIKISAFLGYVFVISRMEEIKRVFRYHGAEHKVIHNYESDKPLSVENARQFSTLHPRCGTSFIFLVILLSIFFFSFFGRPVLYQRIMIHLLLLPLVAGTSYEIIKLAGKEDAHPLIRVLSWPGMMIQKLTTGEPDDSMLEVALTALKSVLSQETVKETRGEIDV